METWTKAGEQPPLQPPRAPFVPRRLVHKMLFLVYDGKNLPLLRHPPHPRLQMAAPPLVPLEPRLPERWTTSVARTLQRGDAHKTGPSRQTLCAGSSTCT